MPLLQLGKLQNIGNTRFSREHYAQTQRMRQLRKTLHHLRVRGNRELMVRKKDGELERFDVNKIIRGLQKACEKRPVTMSQINELAGKVRQDLMLKDTEEVASQEIGDLIMKHLKNVGPHRIHSVCFSLQAV